MNKFSERFKELRIDKGLSRAQVADALFVNLRTVCYWENGQRECSFDMLIKLSDYFNVSVDFLLGRVDF